MDWFDDKSAKAKAKAMANRCCLEVRLFYVRFSGCPLDAAPQVLQLIHHQRTVGSTLELNGTYIPPSEASTLTLRRDRVDRDAAEATYVSTDMLRTTGTLDFEVCNGEKNLLLCGALEKDDGWTLNCKSAVRSGAASPFGKSGVKQTGPPTVEVYVAGCSNGSPLILTKAVSLGSSRRKPRRATLDVIPEDDESDKINKSMVLSTQVSQMLEEPAYEDFDDEKIDPSLGDFYTQGGGFIEGEDGELSWFNAGVRVGVGIGLGMCLGIGIGVGLLMRTYQATTRTFRRRLL